MQHIAALNVLELRAWSGMWLAVTFLLFPALVWVERWAEETGRHRTSWLALRVAVATIAFSVVSGLWATAAIIIEDMLRHALVSAYAD